MSYLARVYRVFIASPSDVIEEREVIRKVVHNWNIMNSATRNIVLLPIGWDTDSVPQSGGSPQSFINKILKDSDLLVGVFWTKIGKGGSIEEFEEHIKTGKPAMLYFSSTPVDPHSIEQGEINKVREFQKSVENRALYKEYNSIAEFEESFNRHLNLLINENDYFSAELEAESDRDSDEYESSFELSKEAEELLLAAVKDPFRTIMKWNDSGGFHIQTNNKAFCGGRNPRDEALWEEAIEELLNYNLLKPEGYKGQSFIVTSVGFRLADLINGQRIITDLSPSDT